MHSPFAVTCLCDIRFEQRDQACEIERKIAETNALVLSTDANRIRDELNRLQTQMMILQSGNGNGNGNNRV